MLKRDITFEDFDGKKVTETHYFNLQKSELLEMEVSERDGFAAMLQRIVATQDAKGLIAEFKKLILVAYGQRSEDGRRFVKNAELREEFSQTAAFDALFMELATNESAAAEFIQGVIPKDLEATLKAATATPAIQAAPADAAPVDAAVASAPTAAPVQLPPPPHIG